MAVRSRRLAGLSVGVALLMLAGWQVAPAQDAGSARLMKDISYIASDECEGRGVGTDGNRRAAEYIASEFKKAGVKPGGKDGSYFQPFTIPGVSLDGPARLILHGPQGQEIVLQAGTHFTPLGLARTGQVSKAPLAFAGYGMTIDQSGTKVYDDFENLDVQGKVVIVLRDLPRADNVQSGLPANPRARALAAKLANAEKLGAAAVLFVNTAKIAADGDDLLVFTMNATDGSTAKLPAFQIKRSVLDELLQATGKSLKQREEEMERTLQPQNGELKGWTATLDLKTKPGVAARNIVGVLEGAGPLANETVVVGAHYDHLGFGIAGSLARLTKPAIHHGADDNGSGTVSVVELARHFAAIPNRQGRRMVFLLFSGEELGLLGSQYYCKEPLFPLENTVAMVNLDMVGRLVADKDTQKGHLLVYGSGSAKPFDELISKLGKKYDFQIVKKHDRIFMASDHYSFYARKVPVIFFFTDDHEDYHRPSDTADRINVSGMKKIVNMTIDILTFLSTVPDRPEYVRLPAMTGGFGGKMPRVGIRPSYGDDKQGVLLEGIAEGGPAEKAGLKSGDRILMLNGKEVKNLESYMTMMANQRAGQVLEFQVLREGQKLVIKVTPE